jgi:hypothetical protein
VSPVDIAHKLSAAWSVFVQQIRRSRTGAALVRAVRATARSFGRVAHQLWLEVTGFTFLVIAGIGALAGFREYNKLQAGQVTGRGRLALAICFTISFAWFGLTSFWRVRRMANRNRRQQA